ncbi:MAG TPA: hypothetical protein VGG98_09960 [Solirubrobacteraceae bacterium]
MLLNLGLNRLDAHVAVGAFTALAGTTNEVRVGASFALVEGVGQAVIAATTADRALEVVLMLAVALAALVVSFEDGLDFLEQLLAD